MTERMTRELFELDGKWFVFMSEHPKEERVIELTDDYRDAEGNFILPEAVAWDGVETCPGIMLGDPDDLD